MSSTFKTIKFIRLIIYDELSLLGYDLLEGVCFGRRRRVAVLKSQGLYYASRRTIQVRQNRRT